MKTLFTVLSKTFTHFLCFWSFASLANSKKYSSKLSKFIIMSSFKRKIEIIAVPMDTSENIHWKLTSSMPSIFRRKVQISAVSKTYISYFEARKYIQYALFFFHGDWVLIATEGNTDFLRILISASML